MKTARSKYPVGAQWRKEHPTNGTYELVTLLERNEHLEVWGYAFRHGDGSHGWRDSDTFYSMAKAKEQSRIDARFRRVV